MSALRHVVLEPGVHPHLPGLRLRGAAVVKRLYGHVVRFDAHGGVGEIRATDGRLFSVHRTGFDDAAVPEPGTAVSFLDDEGRWPRARGVRRLPTTVTKDAVP